MAQLGLNDKAKNLLEYANENRKSGLFNDINIQVGNERFPCNKMVLSCYSTYFQTMFRTEMQERYQDTVELQGFDGKYMKILIDYMYGETIVIDDENVLQVLAAADYVQLQDVKDFCIAYFKMSLSIANCLDALTAYSLYMSLLSPDHIYLFISDNFDAVFEQEKFKHLTTNDLITLLGKLNKSKVNQESMFSAIISWIEHSEEDRKEEFPMMFDLVDLSQLSAEFIEDVAIKNPIVMQNNTCLLLVVMSLTTKIKQTGFKQQSSIQTGSSILSLGGIDKSCVIEVHNISNKPHMEFPNLPTTLRRHCAVKANDFVYCMGGLVSNNIRSRTSKVYKMNLIDNSKKWVEAAPMPEDRYGHAAANFKGNILVTGGAIWLESSSTVILYDIAADVWKMLYPKMNTGRQDHALVVCDDCVFAFGGCNCSNGRTLQSMERLSDLEGKWEIAQPLNVPRHSLAGVSLAGAIYAIGGTSKPFSNKDAKKSVEKFATTQNKWLYVSDMNTARWGHVACVIGEKIYVIGGKDEKGNYITAIECYDPKNDSWVVVGETTADLFRHAVVVV